MGSHIFYPTTRQYRPVLDLPTSEGWKAELACGLYGIRLWPIRIGCGRCGLWPIWFEADIVGVSRDCRNFFSTPIIPGTGKATNFKFCTHILSIDRNKSGKCSRGCSQDSRNISGHLYIGRIARSSLRQLSFLVIFTTINITPLQKIFTLDPVHWNIANCSTIEMLPSHKRFVFNEFLTKKWQLLLK